MIHNTADVVFQYRWLCAKALTWFAPSIPIVAKAARHPTNLSFSASRNCKLFVYSSPTSRAYEPTIVFLLRQQSAYREAKASTQYYLPYKKVKASSYIAQYPVLRTIQRACNFTSLTDLFTQTPFRLLWEASSHMLQIMRKGCSYTYPPLSIVRYSFIELSELEQCRVIKLAQWFSTAVHDTNPGSRSRESEALPLSHCAPQDIHRSGTTIMSPDTSTSRRYSTAAS